MLTVLKFWADWCAPCKAYAPVFDKVAAAVEGVEFEIIDIDEDSETATKYSVRSIPTTVFVKDGEVVDTIVGGVREADLLEKVNEHRG